MGTIWISWELWETVLLAAQSPIFTNLNPPYERKSPPAVQEVWRAAPQKPPSGYQTW